MAENDAEKPRAEAVTRNAVEGLMLQHPLDGALLKFKRAQHHLGNLQADIRTFLGGKPHSVTVERGAKPGQHLVIGHVHRQVPMGLTLIVGDVVHNLRSVLDHLVWELSDRAYRATPGVAKPDQQTQFPIFRHTPVDKKSRARFDRKIQSVPPDARAVIETLQPYAVNPNAPETHPLWQLNDLDIWDKHKRIPLALTTFKAMQYAITGSDGVTMRGELLAERFKFTPNTWLPFEEGAILSTLTAGHQSADGVVHPIEGIVNVDVSVESEIAFGVDTAAQFKPLITTTEGCLIAVAQVIVALRRFFPPEKSTFESSRQ